MGSTAKLEAAAPPKDSDGGVFEVSSMAGAAVVASAKMRKHWSRLEDSRRAVGVRVGRPRSCVEYIYLYAAMDGFRRTESMMGRVAWEDAQARA